MLAISLAACVTAIALPESAVKRLRAAGRASVATPRRALVALLVLSSVVLLGNVFLQQAYAWDEGGVVKAARLVGLRGLDGLREAYRDNAWLGPQHPPLPALIYGGVWALGGSNLVALRLVAVIFWPPSITRA